MIDCNRHYKVFSPGKFGDRRVDVIGCGATGSRIALSLAKLGVANLHIWDFDTVMGHNLANQCFEIAHIDKPKVEAVADVIMKSVAEAVTVHNEAVNDDTSEKLGDIVFLLTDTMKSRKEIWEKHLKFKLNVSLVIETRMGADSCRIYTINPKRPQDVVEWEKTLYSDDVAEESLCGTSTSVGPTAEIVSGLAVWQLIRWFDIYHGDGTSKDRLENEIIFATRSTYLMTRYF